MNDKYRMYGLVPYNLSPIQQGIQFGHAVVEYSLASVKMRERKYSYWAKNCKTFIILNGGTTNWDWFHRPKSNDERLGTLNKHLITLNEMDITVATFSEPDLGDQLTAIVFLVKEEVYNREKYPDPPECFKIIQGTEFDYYKKKTFGSIKEADKVLRMREFLSQFRLA